MSPIPALQLLELHTNKQLTLTTEQFDECIDCVLTALEAANDEKYRLRKPESQVP